MIRYLWVDSARGGDGALVPGAPVQHADYAKAKPQQINGFFFDLFLATKQELGKVWGDGYATGVYFAGNWAEVAGKPGAEIAEIVNERVQELTFGGASTPKVQFDLEFHGPGDAQRLIDCFKRWRELQPKRDTSWTMEGHQGGWIKAQPGLVGAVLAAHVRLAPQCYDADMAGGLWDTHEMARDLVRAGFPDALISPFHDARYLDQQKWWQGFAFSQQRL